MALLNRKTIGLLVSAIVLGGGVLLFESSQGDRTEDTGTNTALGGDAETQGEPIFTFEEEAISQFSVTRAVADDAETTETLLFEKGENGSWRMTEPEAAAAEAGAIAFLLSQITGTASQTLTISPDQLEEFGLTEPEATVALDAEGKSYDFLLGGSDFSGGKRYVRVVDVNDATGDSKTLEESSDAEPEPITIHLVAGSITSAMNRPTPDWLQTEGSTSEEATEGTPAEEEVLSEPEETDTAEPSPEPEDSEEN